MMRARTNYRRKYSKRVVTMPFKNRFPMHTHFNLHTAVHFQIRDLCRHVAHAQKGPPAAFEKSLIALPKTKLMMAVSFMTMFRAGPEVSFSGSPTVSPVTEFLCASDPFTNSLPKPPAEMYFFELSHAPPVLLMEMASCTLETRAPDKRPAQQFFPKPKPATSGLRITRAPGANISRSEASVEILMHLS